MAQSLDILIFDKCRLTLVKLTTKYTDRVPSHGVMAANILESTLTIRKTAMESLYGQTVDPTRATGKMESSTAMVCTSQPMVWKSTGNGTRARDTDGYAETETAVTSDHLTQAEA